MKKLLMALPLLLTLAGCASPAMLSEEDKQLLNATIEASRQAQASAARAGEAAQRAEAAAARAELAADKSDKVFTRGVRK